MTIRPFEVINKPLTLIAGVATMHPNELLYLTNHQNPVKPSKQKLIIILLSSFLGLSLFVNILLLLINIGGLNILPNNSNSNSGNNYTTYTSALELDKNAYQGELVQFRADPYTLTAINKNKTLNDFMWRFSGKDYGVVLRFPLNLKPVATGMGLYSGKVLPREVYGDNKLIVIFIDSVKG